MGCNDNAPGGQQSRPAGAESLHDWGPAPVEDGPADHFSMMARTSRAERMRYSSPEYFTSVPPYLL